MMGSLAACLLMASSSLAQTTRPDPNPRELEICAVQAFRNQQFAIALPLLRRLALEVKDKPAKLRSTEERIRACEQELVKSAAALRSARQQAAPGDGAPTAPAQRKLHLAPNPGEVVELSIKDLGNFDFDEESGGNIPTDVTRLSGARVRLRGFMIPMDQTTRITQFALVPSLGACCFGRPPQVQHMVVVTCGNGRGVTYTGDEIFAEGTLKVEEKKDDGYIISIFQLDLDSIRPVPKI
jgi:hypothetical protein